jgi:hypothetical protein
MSGRVMIVDQAYEADYKVWFCDGEYNQRNHQLLQGCQLVTYSPDVKVVIVQSEYEADICITRQNFPRS